MISGWFGRQRGDIQLIALRKFILMRVNTPRIRLNIRYFAACSPRKHGDRNFSINAAFLFDDALE
jgi:hypothetical protein